MTAQRMFLGARPGPRLNYRLILPVVSGTVIAVALGLLVCMVVALAYDDGGELAFGGCAAVTGPLGLAGVLYSRRLEDRPLRTRDGYLAVTLAWVAAAAIGAVPFMLTGTLVAPSDAFFESMSGFTTTGASVIDRLEGQSHSILLWRSLSQWMGGVGIVVLVVAIAPATGLASRVFYAETSGIGAERLTPRIAETAKILWGIYLMFTLAGILAYAAVGLSWFDAVNHSFTSISTAGFSTRTESIGAYDSLGVELVAMTLMALGGVNFAFYWRALTNRASLLPQLPELRVYFGLMAVATAVIAFSLTLTHDLGLDRALRDAAFAVVSITTTTGYITADFDLWSDFSGLVLLALMFVGGCAGSTAGGMKVIRIMLLGKAAVHEVQRQLQPTAVQVLRLGDRVFGEEVRRGVLGFFYIYVTAFLGGSLIMAAVGLDEVTAVSSTIATLNIVGPALGGAGAIENYDVVPPGGLWVLSLLMLIGRLEVFTVLVLLTPAFWRRNSG